jgi:hypothetical protein
MINFYFFSKNINKMMLHLYLYYATRNIIIIISVSGYSKKNNENLIEIKNFSLSLKYDKIIIFN